MMSIDNIAILDNVLHKRNALLHFLVNIFHF